MEYVLGIDGGGSKTEIAQYNISGEKIDLIDWGPTNHEALPHGFKSLEQELKEILISITKRNNISISDISNGVFGLSGLDTVSQYERIKKIIESLGLKRIRLVNDAFLGIKAGSKCGYGICSVNGTGCTVAGIDKKGKQIQIGGQGQLTGDFGGGYILGNAVISAIYSFLYKYGEYTILKDMVFKEL